MDQHTRVEDRQVLRPWTNSALACQRQNPTATQLRAKKTLLVLWRITLHQIMLSFQKNSIPLNPSGLSTSLRSSPARMANSSSVATLETIWAINVDSVIMEIPRVIIEEIRAHPTHTMGWFSPKLQKAWKLLFPLTPTSSALGYLHLTNPAWGRMIDPWWKFLSDTQGPKEVRKLV